MLNSTNNHKFIESHLKSLVDLVPNHAHIQLDACNDFILPSNWDFKNRTNSNYHLAYVKSGSGSYTVDGEEIHMTPGRIYLFSKQCLHSRRLDQKDLPRIALLRFSILDNKNNMPFSHSFDGHALSYVTGKTKVLLPLLNTLFSYYMDESDAYKPLCQILLSQLLHEMNLDIKDSNTSSRIDPRLTRAHSYITKQFKTSISLDHLVKLSSLSRNYFLKMFKECYGTSPPKQLQIQLRIDSALESLMETEMSIKAISEELGYSDQFCFSRQFGEIMGGVSPSSYRNQRYQDLP